MAIRWWYKEVKKVLLWSTMEMERGVGVEVGIIVRRQHQGNERKSWQGKEQWTLVFFGIVIFSI